MCVIQVYNVHIGFQWYRKREGHSALVFISYLSHTITRDIVGAALAAVQVLPCGVIPIWNATAAGVETAKQNLTVTTDGIQIKL